ncbi:MAG: hypothetical protein ACRC14_05510 [Paracoccaceae bacterium]
MSVILVLFSGVVGFFSAVISLVLFDATLLQAASFWLMPGFAALVLVTLPSVLPRRGQAEDRQPEVA